MLALASNWYVQPEHFPSLLTRSSLRPRFGIAENPLTLETYLETFGLSCRYLAGRLDVSPSTLNRLLNQQSGISPEMALRLSKALGRTPESWLAMQDMYDLWVASKNVKLDKVQRIELDVA